MKCHSCWFNYVIVVLQQQLLNSIFEHCSVISLRVVFKKFSQHQPVLFKVNTIFTIEFFISVWPGILILHDRSWSILVQFMACRLKAPHHLLVSILINITSKISSNTQEHEKITSWYFASKRLLVIIFWTRLLLIIVAQLVNIQVCVICTIYQCGYRKYH